MAAIECVLGADEGNAFVFAALGKGFVLAQEAIARVHGLCAGLLAGGNDLVGQQVRLAAGRGPMICTASSASLTWRASLSASE
jgi:hypothetical protein